MAIPTPISFWNFDEPSGNALDARGVNTLTNVGSTGYSTGQLNNGADVTANTKGFAITDAAQSGLDLSGDFSFSLWVKPVTVADNRMIQKFGAPGQRSYRLDMNSDATCTIYAGVLQDGSTEAQVSWNLAAAMTTGVWHHLVWTWAAATSKANLYFDGNVQAEKTTTGVTSLFNSTADFNVGRLTAASIGSNASYDAVGAWNVVLSPADASSLWNGGTGRQYPFPSYSTSSLLFSGVGS